MACGNCTKYCKTRCVLCVHAESGFIPNVNSWTHIFVNFLAIIQEITFTGSVVQMMRVILTYQLLWTVYMVHQIANVQKVTEKWEFEQIQLQILLLVSPGLPSFPLVFPCFPSFLLVSPCFSRLAFSGFRHCQKNWSNIEPKTYFQLIEKPHINLIICVS